MPKQNQILKGFTGNC